MVNGTARERIGNSVYGQYGQDFTSSDGASFMIVALTGRHFRDLTELTGTTKAVAALAETLGADFTDEGDRYRHRDALTGLFTEWFSEHTRERDRRRAVGDFRAVGALPHLRRRRRRRPGHRQSVVHPAGSAADRASTWRRACPCRSTASTRRRSPLRRSATTPPRCLADWLGMSAGRDRPAHRIGRATRWRDERAARAARPAAGQRRRHLDRARQRPGRQALVRRAVHRAEPGRRVPHRRRRNGRRPTCICSSCAAARPANPSSTPSTRVFDGRTAAARRVDSRQNGRLLTTATVSFAADAARPRTRHRRRRCPPIPASLPHTGPAGPGAVDAVGRTRHQDRRRHVERRVRAATVVAGNRPVPDDPLVHTLIAVYVTDVYMIDPALQVHGHSMKARTHRSGTTDSSIWFHRPVRADQWNLLESPLTGRGARTRRRHRQPDPRRRRHRRHAGAGGSHRSGAGRLDNCAN